MQTFVANDCVVVALVGRTFLWVYCELIEDLAPNKFVALTMGATVTVIVDAIVSVEAASSAAVVGGVFVVVSAPPDDVAALNVGVDVGKAESRVVVVVLIMGADIVLAVVLPFVGMLPVGSCTIFL